MINKFDVAEFDKMYDIMKKSFPSDEYRTYDEQKALFENEYYSVYADKDREEVKGFIAVWDFAEFLYIEHFAVNPHFRNQGIGGKLLKNVAELFKKPACLEVEPPSDDITRRRIGFYERNGFFYNDYHYIQPSISKGKNPVPLRIMSSGKNLSEKEFFNIKRTLYNKVYGYNKNDF